MAVALQLRVLEVVTLVFGVMLTPLKTGSLFNTVTESDSLLPSSSPSLAVTVQVTTSSLERLDPARLAPVPTTVLPTVHSMVEASASLSSSV